MYCRACYYDLRGQEMGRCPECGTTFDLGDPETFLDRPPRGVARLWHRYRRLGPKMIVCLTVAWCITVFVVAPYLARDYSHRMTVWHVGNSNLKGIMTTWIIQQHDRPEHRPFDQDAAKLSMRPSWSPWTEGWRARLRLRVGYVLRKAPIFAGATLVYALLMASLLSRAGRRLTLGVAVCALLVFLLSEEPIRVANFLCRGSYAFLSDYTYIPDVDLTSSAVGRGTTIAAYDTRSFSGHRRRLIAFADGHVELLWDDSARQLFEAQGLEYPSQSAGATSEDGD